MEAKRSLDGFNGFVMIEVLASLAIASILIVSVLGFLQSIQQSRTPLPPGRVQELSLNDPSASGQTEPLHKTTLENGGQWTSHRWQNPDDNQSWIISTYSSPIESTHDTAPR
ncbi:MAG: type II secretion system protein J [bacterium]